jgi:hypothetical protein
VKQRKRRIIAALIALAAASPVFAPAPALAAPAAILTANHDGLACRRVDPIVTPGGESAHGHSFYGVRGVTADTRTSASLRALPSTWVRASNHSAFWVPCVYETRDGVTRLLTPLGTKHILAYYQLRSTTKAPPPEDTAGVSHEMGYRCTIGGGSVSDTPPAWTDNEFVLGGFMRGERDLGLSGNTVFDVRVFIRLDRGRTGPLGTITLGAPPGGATHPVNDLHFDYIWAHDRAKFQAFINQCAPPAGACGTNPAVLA